MGIVATAGALVGGGVIMLHMAFAGIKRLKALHRPAHHPLGAGGFLKLLTLLMPLVSGCSFSLH